MSTEQSSEGLQVRCPTCHEACELTVADSKSDIKCDSCGTFFNLSPEETRPYISGRDMIGQFRLLDQIGAGTFGDVWLAEDTTLERRVALKVARPDRYDSSDADLFFREARAAAQLKHPNIVSVHEVGLDKDRMFIVSEFIKGATLGDQILTRRFPAREVAELCATIADGLHHAHEAGVIHRDLKPHNILIDLAGIPHIADFGLAKRETGEMTITIDGNVIGTPSYMSPEQADGDAHQTDRRTDIYSLGVILFLMLTDELPFRGNYRMLLVQIINDAPPSLRRLESSIPKDLETICLKCLEKRPEHRYETAADLAADLRRWLARKPILAAPPGPFGRLLRWSQRKPALAALSMILTVVLVVSSVAVGWQYRVAVQANRELMITQVDALRTANAEEARVLLTNIARFDDQVLPELRASRSSPELSERQNTRFAIALLPFDPGEVEYLFNRIPNVEVDEISLILDALLGHADDLTPRLWELATADDTETHIQLRLAAVLAVFDPDSDRWESIANDVVASLTAIDELEARKWVELLSGGSQWLLPEFRSLYRTTERDSSRDIAAHALVRFLRDDVDQLVDLLKYFDIRQVPVVVDALKKHGAEAVDQLETLASLKTDPSEEDVNRICNAAVTLACMNREDVAWRLLEDGVPLDIQVDLIHRIAPAGVPPEILARQLGPQASTSVRRNALLALGEYENFQMTARLRNSVSTQIEQISRQDDDVGVHSAAEWLLRKWIPDRENSRQPESLRPGRNWFVTPTGITMAVGRGPIYYTAGSPPQVPPRPTTEALRDVKINYSFALSTYEITLSQYERFAKGKHDPTIGPEPDCPVNKVSFNELAAYCRWLTLQEGMTEDDMCFPPFDPKSRESVIPYEDYLSRAGYRPPTQAEWEYMCRAGSNEERFTGSSPARLEKYAWFRANANMRSWPVGTLKPNAFGLFDVYGNVSEMTLPNGGHVELASMFQRRLILACGCGYLNQFEALRSSTQLDQFSYPGSNDRGIRVARTLPSN